jgi:glycerophosphoryl diester phosphodiesterase
MKIYLLPLLIFSIFSLPLLAQEKNQNIFPKSKNKIIVIAHRGDHTKAPENSLLAIENAINDGADYVELDLRTTKDGQLVLMHDATVDRMTNGTGKVSSLSYDSIRTLKLFNKNISNSDTVQVPSFEEALNACKNKINIYLDFKEANVQQAYTAILKANMENQMVVYINAPIQYVDWRKWVPKMPLILSLNTKIKDSLAMVNYLDRINIDILDGNWYEYTKETVQAALSKGVPVWADMQSKLEDDNYWRKGLILGLTGIQTDHPKELVQLIKTMTQAGDLKY